MPRHRAADWFVCPVCGSEVPQGALACRECGADEQTGWSKDAYLDDLDLPPAPDSAVPDTFEEFERLTRRPHRHARTFLIALVVLLVLGIVLSGLR